MRKHFCDLCKQKIIGRRFRIQIYIEDIIPGLGKWINQKIQVKMYCEKCIKESMYADQNYTYPHKNITLKDLLRIVIQEVKNIKIL